MVRSLVLNSDGQILASGSQDQTIRLWDVNSGACFKILQGHTRSIVALAFDPNRNMIASSAYDQSIRLWSMNDYQCIRVLQINSDQLRSIAFSPDGSVLASGGSEGIIKLWDVCKGIYSKSLVSNRPYEHMNITSVTGLTEAQKSTLKALGAIEN